MGSSDRPITQTLCRVLQTLRKGKTEEIREVSMRKGKDFVMGMAEDKNKNSMGVWSWDLSLKRATTIRTLKLSKTEARKQTKVTQSK